MKVAVTTSVAICFLRSSARDGVKIDLSFVQTGGIVGRLRASKLRQISHRSTVDRMKDLPVASPGVLRCSKNEEIHLRGHGKDETASMRTHPRLGPAC